MVCFCFETDPFGFIAERKRSFVFQLVYKEMSEKFEFFEFLACLSIGNKESFTHK